MSAHAPKMENAKAEQEVSAPAWVPSSSIPNLLYHFHRVSWNLQEQGPAYFGQHYVDCDGCGEIFIKGYRYRCNKCKEHDICMKCHKQWDNGNGSITNGLAKKQMSLDPKDHDFVKVRLPNTGKVPYIKLSREAVEGLANNLLLITTFTLGFSISFMAASFNREDLYDLDVRFFKLEQSHPGDVERGFGHTPGKGNTILSPSNSMLENGLWANLYMAISLALGLGIQVSLSLFNAREGDFGYRTWVNTLTLYAMAGYGLYFFGFMCFYDMVTIAAISLYPSYCDRTRGSMFTIWTTNSSFDTSGPEPEINDGCVMEHISSRRFNTQVLLGGTSVYFALLLLYSVLGHVRTNRIRRILQSKVHPHGDPTQSPEENR